MTEKKLLKFIKENVSEMGLKDKIDFFHWLMDQISKDLNQDVVTV